MIRFLSFFIAALLSACGGGGGDNSPVSAVVTLYGDSIAMGYGVQVSPAARLRQSGFAVVDKSAGGLRLHQLLEGYEEPYENAPAAMYPNGPQPPFANSDRPRGQIVVVQLGVNDALRSRTDYQQNLRRLVDMLRADGNIVVLTGIVGLEPDIERTRADANAATLALAKEYGLPHAGWGEAYQGQKDLQPDRVHRTQEASDRLANLLVAAIDRAAVQ